MKYDAEQSQVSGIVTEVLTAFKVHLISQGSFGRLSLWRRAITAETSEASSAAQKLHFPA